MSHEPAVQTITSGSDQRMNVPVVTVESFLEHHGKKLQLKLHTEHNPYYGRVHTVADLVHFMEAQARESTKA